MSYNEQIEFKKEFISSKFNRFYKGEFEFFASYEKHYRSRAEFGIYHDGDKLSYTMNGYETKYLKIDKCPKVDAKIYALMPELLAVLEKDKELNFKLFEVEFVATKFTLLVVLLYHRDVSQMSAKFKSLSENLGINIITRSRGKKQVFGSDILRDEFEVMDKKYVYEFESGAFIQPNRYINSQMMKWIVSNVDSRRDLLEMYCGHGNFTVPLSFKFRTVLANEISKSSIKHAINNAKLNNAKNISFARVSSQELMSAFEGIKFKRLQNIDINAFDFSHILVDPPRAGLGSLEIEFMKNYPNLLYISCNTESLERDLSELTKTHKVVKFAIFDQFVHTKHVECGVVLEKI